KDVALHPAPPPVQVQVQAVALAHPVRPLTSQFDGHGSPYAPLAVFNGFVVAELIAVTAGSETIARRAPIWAAFSAVCHQNCAIATSSTKNVMVMKNVMTTTNSTVTAALCSRAKERMMLPNMSEGSTRSGDTA